MDNAVVVEHLEYGYDYRHNKDSDEAEELESDIHAHDADYRRDAEVARDYLRLDYLAYDRYAGIYDNEPDSESVAAVYQREHCPRDNDRSCAEHGQDINYCGYDCDNKYISALVHADDFQHAKTYRHLGKSYKHYQRIGLDELAHGREYDLFSFRERSALLRGQLILDEADYSVISGGHEAGGDNKQEHADQNTRNLFRG